MSNQDALIAAIHEAIESKALLKIRYHGGAQPGSVRELTPVTISESHFKAHCPRSDSVKSFRLDRAELVDDSVPESYNPDLNPQPMAKTKKVREPERHTIVEIKIDVAALTEKILRKRRAS